MDSKLKLLITTALDNAGIKATQQQIDGLQDSIKKGMGSANKEIFGVFGETDKQVNKLHKGVKTLMKDVGIAIGATKLIGTAMADVYDHMLNKGESFSEAFTSMWTKMTDNIRKMLFGTNASEIFQNISKETEKAAAAQTKYIETVVSNLDRQTQKINDATIAYVNQADAVAGLRKAGTDAELIQYQRAKLYDVERVRAAQGEEAARQLAALYDITIEKVSQSHQIDAFDAETSKLQAKWESDFSKLDVAKEKYDTMKGRLAVAQKGVDDIQKEIELATQNIDPSRTDDIQRISDAIYASRRKQLEFAKRQFDKAEDLYGKAIDQTNLDETEMYKREMLRENMQSQAAFALENKALDYDRIIGDSSFRYYDFDDKSRKELTEIFNKSYDYQKETAENTGELATMLERLLQLK